MVCGILVRDQGWNQNLGIGEASLYWIFPEVLILDFSDEKLSLRSLYTWGCQEHRYWKKISPYLQASWDMTYPVEKHITVISDSFFSLPFLYFFRLSPLDSLLYSIRIPNSLLSPGSVSCGYATFQVQIHFQDLSCNSELRNEGPAEEHLRGSDVMLVAAALLAWTGLTYTSARFWKCTQLHYLILSAFQ